MRTQPVNSCRGIHGKMVPDIKMRNMLAISVNYQVPRNHRFRCFTLVVMTVSHGHSCQELPTRQPPTPCEVCHEIHQGERCGWYEHQETVQHDFDSINNSGRANQARARSAVMAATAYASVAGSQLC
jgi:hypothetical protein